MSDVKVRRGDLLRLPGTDEWCTVTDAGSTRHGIPYANVNQRGENEWWTLQVALLDDGTYPPDRVRRIGDDIADNIIRGSE